jgi:uncharacterized membrane protein (UPF0136 family)
VHCQLKIGKQRNRSQATMTGGAMSGMTRHKRLWGWLLVQGSWLGIGSAAVSTTVALSASCAIALWSRIAQAQPRVLRYSLT